MAHWFHRNPLKATATVNFDLRQVLSTHDASKICSDLRLCRAKLLELLTDPNNDRNLVETELNVYLSLFYGFIIAIESQGVAAAESKLRRLIRYRWTQTMQGFVPVEENDAYFEVLSMLLNVALWLSKHAAKISAKDEVSENDAKQIHSCLRKAAGLVRYIINQKTFLGEPESGNDFDARILNAYFYQFTAEAQEVTVARAIELQHKVGLISSLAYETSNLFKKAGECLEQFEKSDAEKFGKWCKYLQLKQQFYLAYAYSYLGEVVLAEDKCGLAIAALKQSVKSLELAESLCKEYSKSRGPGNTVKPDKHLFFRQLRPVVQRTLEKCERENGFIYHQKVADEPPELEMNQATFGLVKPDEFVLPAPNSAWSPQTYIAFDISKAPMPDFSKAKKGSKELPAVKEAPIYQTEQDPKNASGCVIS